MILFTITIYVLILAASLYGLVQRDHRACLVGLAGSLVLLAILIMHR